MRCNSSRKIPWCLFWIMCTSFLYTQYIQSGQKKDCGFTELIYIYNSNNTDERLRNNMDNQPCRRDSPVEAEHNIPRWLWISQKFLSMLPWTVRHCNPLRQNEVVCMNRSSTRINKYKQVLDTDRSCRKITCIFEQLLPCRVIDVCSVVLRNKKHNVLTAGTVYIIEVKWNVYYSFFKSGVWRYIISIYCYEIKQVLIAVAKYILVSVLIYLLINTTHDVGKNKNEWYCHFKENK